MFAKIKKLFSRKKETTKTIKSNGSIGFATKLKNIFTSSKTNNELIDEIEKILITADVGHKTTQKLINSIRNKANTNNQNAAQDVKNTLKENIIAIMQNTMHPLNISQTTIPTSIIVCGVNGNGKTTTIGKLAHQYTNNNKKVVIGACDSFRAAASEQLQVWSNRSNCTMISSTQDNASPSGVAYRAAKEALESKADILLIDTAGRLHTNKNLMAELQKINKNVCKLLEKEADAVIMVIDATTGQNALKQINEFRQFIDISGIIITKMDGTAKGGVALRVAEEHPEIKIYAIGVGEGIDDLRHCSASEFADMLLED